MKKVRPGEKVDLTARTWNRIFDAVAKVDHNNAIGGVGGDARCSLFNQSIMVKNGSDDVPEFGILGIDDSDSAVTDEQFFHRVFLSGVSPTLADHAGKFAIAIEPITSGDYGQAVMSGPCVAIVDVQATTDQYADVYNGETTKLKSYPAGSARILSDVSTTGTQWCVLLLGNGLPVCETTQAATMISTGTSLAWISFTTACPA